MSRSGNNTYQSLLLKFEDMFHESILFWMVELSEKRIMTIHMSPHGLGSAWAIECLELSVLRNSK
jgi:hypothetical protein